jgi:hypothetical protein
VAAATVTGVSAVAVAIFVLSPPVLGVGGPPAWLVVAAAKLALSVSGTAAVVAAVSAVVPLASIAALIFALAPLGEAGLEAGPAAPAACVVPLCASMTDPFDGGCDFGDWFCCADCADEGGLAGVFAGAAVLASSKAANGCASSS